MVTLAPVDSLYPLVRERITGPLDFMMRKALVEAAIEFCRESLLVQDSIGPMSVDMDETISLVPADQPYQGRKIIRAYGDSQKSEGAQLVAGKDYSQQSGNVVQVHRPLAQLSIIFVIEPRITAYSIPGVLIDDYAEAVACGAVCRLAEMPGKPWYNQQLAQLLHPDFVDGYRAAFRWRLDNTAVNAFQNRVTPQEFF